MAEKLNKDYVGETVNGLKIVGLWQKNRCGNTIKFKYQNNWKCQCKCGRIFNVRAYKVKNGTITECGKCKDFDIKKENRIKLIALRKKEKMRKKFIENGFADEFFENVYVEKNILIPYNSQKKLSPENYFYGIYPDFIKKQNEAKIIKEQKIKEYLESRNNMADRYIGAKYGKLTIKRAFVEKNKIMWECICDCGNTYTNLATQIKIGCFISCGCISKERRKTFNVVEKQLYIVYTKMISRCYDEVDDNYRNYGGRGITVCDEWRSDIRNFFDWAISSGYKVERLDSGRNKWTIDRIDNNGNYEPTNCRWDTSKEQGRNTRQNVIVNVNGVNMVFAEMCEKYNLAYSSALSKYRRGYSCEDIINGNKKPYKKRKQTERPKRIHKYYDFETKTTYFK